MIQDQAESLPRRCPRCGGLMRQPAGSVLYWHADNNHPRCDITNLIDAPLAEEPPEPEVGEPKEDTGNSQKKNQRRKK